MKKLRTIFHQLFLLFIIITWYHAYSQPTPEILPGATSNHAASGHLEISNTFSVPSGIKMNLMVSRVLKFDFGSA